MENDKAVVVRDKIKGFMPQLKQVLGSDNKSKISTYASALQQLAFNKNLANCNVDSVLQAGFEIVRAGLNPNPIFGQAYVVPYGKQAQLQIGYKGWIALGYRYGWKFRAVAVYNCDEFDMKFNGLTDIYDFTPNWEEREDDNGGWVHSNLKGVIVYAKDNIGNEFTEFVSFKKLEKLRMQNEFQIKEFKEKLTNKYGKQFENLWYKWAEEMYKAKALKYIVTRLPIQEEIITAGHIEDAEIADTEEPTSAKKENNRQNPLATVEEEPQEADIEEVVEDNKLDIEKVKEELQNYAMNTNDEAIKAYLIQLLRKGSNDDLIEKYEDLGLCH